MKKLLALVLLFISAIAVADEINPVAADEVNEFLVPDTIKSNKIMLKVGKLAYTEPDEKNPAPEVTDADKKLGFIPFKRHYLETINYNTNPLKKESYPEALEAVAAQGEREPMTMALYPLEKTKVSVTISDLTGKSGGKITKDNIEFRQVRHLLKTVQTGIVRITPEMMIRDNPVKLYPGVARQLWLEVKVPADAKADTYEGEMKLKAEGKDAYTVKLRVEVYPFKLMIDPEVSFGWFGNPWEGINLDSYVEHGNSWLGTSMNYTVKYDGGTAKVDTSNLDKHYQIIKKYGWENHDLWISNYFPYYELTQTHHLGYFSPEFNKAYKDCLAQIVAWAKSKNLKIVIGNHDEPRENEPYRNYENTQKLCKLSKEVPGVRMAINNQDSYGIDYTGFVDTHDVLYPNMSPLTVKTVAKAKAQKKELWFYNSGRDRISFGFMTWKHGGRQRIEWAWGWAWDERTSKNADSWSSAIGGDPACGIQYPVKGEILPTPYLEWTSEGKDDFDYCYTLEQMIKKANESKNAEAVKQASASKAILDTIRDKVPATVGGDGNTAIIITDNSKTNYLVDEWRKKIAGEIIKLGKLVQ